MKISIIAFFFMFCFGVFSQILQPWNLNRDYGIPEDITEILESATSKQLEENSEADQIILLANKRARVLKNNNNPLWYDEFVIACLLKVIKQFPNSRAALTAKLYLATALIKTFAPDPDNFQLTESDQKAHKIFESIATQHPEEWEGLAAKIFLEGMELLFGKDSEEARKRLEQMIPLVEKIEANLPENVNWYRKYIVDFNKPFDLEIYDLLCLYAEEKQDKALYESMKEKILKKYPKSHSARFLK